ncbi:Ankyrin repeat family protein [Rhynchospora pubera]|uniref:Ankyrin repeat family protein n=1 Tax=Rhynchospora pubera TaxID=906938 RepID=A0AAV8H767_9POAL|nr:Ankyrin repeat family protein [Rhynchospora pubera]
MAEETTPIEFLRGETSNPSVDLEAGSADINESDIAEDQLVRRPVFLDPYIDAPHFGRYSYMKPHLEIKLSRAAAVGDTKVIDELRQSEDFKNFEIVTEYRGNTLLHLAVIGGHMEFVRHVATQKHELLHRVNRNYETPLILAAASKNEELGLLTLKLMNELGGGEFEVRKRLLQADRNGDNAAHHALKSGHINLALRLIESNEQICDRISHIKESLMFLATWRGYEDVVGNLMKTRWSKQKGPANITVLHAAVLVGNADLVMELLSIQDNYGRGSQALVAAIRSHDLHIVQSILTRFPEFGLPTVFDNPFFVAAQEDAVSIAEEIIRHCTIMAALHCDEDGRSALHIAVANGHVNFVKFILSQPGLSRLLNKADKDGKTALHLAAIQCKPRIIREILTNQQDKHFSIDREGFTALDYAYYNIDHYRHRRQQQQQQQQSLSSQTSDHQMGKLKWGDVVALLSNAGCPHTAPYYVRAEAKQNFINEIRDHANQVTRSYRSSTSTVGILITTVTFAAAFTLPGGYVQDPGPQEGFPVFSGKPALQAFLISDTFAMCASLMAAFICNMYQLSDVDFVLYYAKKIGYLMWFAYVTTGVAFASGLYTILAPTHLWLFIIICVPCIIVPFLSYFFVEWPRQKLNYQVSRALKMNLEEVL